MCATVTLVSRPFETTWGTREELFDLSKQRSEPLIPKALPELPWQCVATDLKEKGKIKGKSYVLVVDYYSRFIEVTWLDCTTSEEVILRTKAIFARHRIHKVVVSDNGPQYSSKAYAAFAQQFQFKHVTSSPHYPQSNGEAERAVQKMKNLLKREGDPYLALLSYRSTLLKCGFSPSELGNYGQMYLSQGRCWSQQY